MAYIASQREKVLEEVLAYIRLYNFTTKEVGYEVLAKMETLPKYLPKDDPDQRWDGKGEIPNLAMGQDEDEGSGRIPDQVIRAHMFTI